MNDIDDDTEPEERMIRGRGFLASDVNRICRMWLNDEFTLPEGRFMTPFIIAKLIKEIDQIDELPSMGAVNRVLKKWEANGYALCRVNPFGFVCFSERGAALGLDEYTKELKNGE